jgi:hypothetical protein
MVTTAGDVGIGTSAPTGMLHCVGNVVVDGLLRISEVTETFTTLANAGNTIQKTVNHDFTAGSIFRHTTLVDNFAANFTNVPVANDRMITLTLMLEQGPTAYLANACQVAGVSYTVRWQGNAEPTPTSNAVEFQSFFLMRAVNDWKVLSHLVSYGG